MPFSCLEEGINQCIGTDSEVLNNWWDIFARLPNMCYLFEKWQGMNLPSFIIFNNKKKKKTPHQQTSLRDGTTKTKNWKRAEKNLQQWSKNGRQETKHKTHLQRQMEVATEKKREGNAAPQEAPVDRNERGIISKAGKQFVADLSFLTTSAALHGHKPVVKGRPGLINKLERTARSSTCPRLTPLACWFTTITVSSWICAKRQGDLAWAVPWLIRFCHKVMRSDAAVQITRGKRKEEANAKDTKIQLSADQFIQSFGYSSRIFPLKETEDTIKKKDSNNGLGLQSNT